MQFTMQMVRAILAGTVTAGALLLGALWSAICAIVATPLFLIYHPAGEWVHQAFGRGWVWLMGIDVVVEDFDKLPTNGVYASNHESMFDVLILASLPISYRWISKVEVGRIPLIGWAMKAMGCYFVRRDRSGHDLAVMRKVEEDLRKGSAILIFPEGTRTRTGDLLPFKKGAFVTAINAGVPLCPIAISGTRSIAPPGTIPSRNHRVMVRFGAPMRPIGRDVTSTMNAFRQELTLLLTENRKQLNIPEPPSSRAPGMV